MVNRGSHGSGMPAERLAVGVDIGGTKIAIALVDGAGMVTARHRLSTDPGQGVDAVLDRIAEGVRHVTQRAEHPVAGVGVGCPGQVDPLSGIVRDAVNLGWDDVRLRDGISERLGGDVPVWVEKDANAAALGEQHYGAAMNCRDFIYIAIGTGLGAGAVVNGELVVGANACAMEVGHMPLVQAGRPCVCGLRGCPEMYVAGVGLLAAVREYAPRYPDSPLADRPSTAQVLEAARRGDPLAVTVMHEALHWHTVVLACCATLFNPALLVIGGGLGHAAADYFVDRARERLLQELPFASQSGLRIVPSKVEDSAVGAACLVWHGIARAGVLESRSDVD